MDDKQIDEVWLAMYKQPHYLMPYSSGEYMVYHHGTSRLPYGSFGVDPNAHYEIIRPRSFRLKLFYEDNLIKLSKDKLLTLREAAFSKNVFVEIPMQIKLEDYFEIKNWRGRDIPIALKRFELEYRVERLKNLLAFS